MPKAYLLGTNGWYTSGTGSTVCTLLEYPKFNIVLDGGDGFSKLGGVIDFKKQTYLLLSHLHLDHISGLHNLPRYVFKKDLSVLLSAKSVKALKAFLDFPYTAPARLFKRHLGYDVKITGLPARGAKFPFKLTALPLIHSVETSGYRIEAEGKVVAYVVDTGFCENAVTLADNADLLIVECSHRPGETNEDWPHLSPELAAAVAARASCKRMVMTHFDASRYDSRASRAKAVLVAKKVFKNSSAGRDGMVLDF